MAFPLGRGGGRLRVALAVFLLCAAASQAALAGLPAPRHVDPSAVGEEGPSPLELLALYRAVVEAVTAGDYGEADLRLRETLRVYAPPNVRYVLDRFNDLLSQEVDLLNATHAGIELARALIDLGLLDEAGVALENATVTLARANITYMELFMAAGEFRRYLRVPKVEETIADLGAVLKLYRGEITELSALLESRRIEGIVRTRMTLEVNATAAWVGSKLRVSGELTTAGGDPLPGRRVTILMGGESREVLTDQTGRFEADVRVPYVYRPEIALRARFVPTGDDVGALAGCGAGPVTISLLYVTPNLTLSVDPPRVTPLGTLTVAGRSDVPHLRLVVRAFGREVWTEADSMGEFSAEIRVPAEARDGPHVVRVESEPESVVGPAEASASVEVYRIPVDLEEVSLSRLAISGLTGVRVEGEVLAGGSPLGGAEVTVEGFDEVVVVQTDEWGRFSVEISPGHAVPTGSHRVSVLAVPDQPWYATASEEASVLVVNLYTTSLLVALGSILARRAWSTRVRPGGPREEEAGVAPTPPRPPRERPRRLSEVAAAYLAAVELVGSKTGVRMRPSHTIREYLEATLPKLGPAADPFIELSALAERTIYGGREPDLERVILLLEIIKSALEGEESA